MAIGCWHADGTDGAFEGMMGEGGGFSVERSSCASCCLAHCQRTGGLICLVCESIISWSAEVYTSLPSAYLVKVQRP